MKITMKNYMVKIIWAPQHDCIISQSSYNEVCDKLDCTSMLDILVTCLLADDSHDI